MLGSQAVELGIVRDVTEHVCKFLLASIVVLTTDRAQVFLLTAFVIHGGPIVQQSLSLLEVSCRLLPKIVHITDSAISIRHKVTCNYSVGLTAL